MHPHHVQASADVAIPACPSNFPQISAMPLEELQRLVDDPAALDMLVREHPHTLYVSCFEIPFTVLEFLSHSFVFVC